MKPEIYITYCIFADEDAFKHRDIRFETDYRHTALQWLKGRPDYIMKVCASCEISNGGAMEFAYGDTAKEARAELQKRLNYYGRGTFTI